MKVQVFAERKTLDTIYLQWNPETTEGNDAYDVYFAASDTEKLRKIAQSNTFSYLHKNQQLLNNNRIRYAVGKGDQITASVYPENLGDDYLYALAENYHWQLRFAGQGVLCNVFCYTGTHNYCPECYSKEAQKQIKSSCTNCDGSGELEGYTGPIVVFIAIQDAPETEYYIAGLEKPRLIYAAWMGNIPLVKKKDLIVDSNGYIYMITRDPRPTTVGSIHHTRFVVRQDLVIERIETESKYYEKFKRSFRRTIQ